MSWDGTNILLFGGTDSNNVIKGDTWVWNGSMWMQVFPDPAPLRLIAVRSDR